MSPWRHVIAGLGVLLLATAVVKTAYDIGGGGGGVLLAGTLDFILISTAGLVLVYVWRWLPTTTIEPTFYPRIVAWVGGGLAVMALVTVLRILHPGVEVAFTFGARSVSLAIGSIAGLGIGVHEAQALTHAERLARQNRELQQKHAIEQQNEKLKRAERRLEEAVRQLEASNERLEQFAYAASHDLQEPLRMVTTYLQLVERRYGDRLDEDGLEFVAFAVDGAVRMRAMIDGLLEYSRVESQGAPFEPVRLDAVLDDVLADLQFRIEETGAEISREALPTVAGDARQLTQVLQNLVTNAIEYRGEHAPRIHLSAVNEGGQWVVSVRDDGIGIDSTNAGRIFDLFQRLHTIDEHPGSGIGLALCKRIVERHHGQIWVESEPGRGSTFSFSLLEPSDAPDPLAPLAG